MKYKDDKDDKDDNDDKLLYPAEAADILGTTVNVLTVWRSTRRHSIPYVKIGRSIRYRKSDLLKFIAKNIQE